MEMYTVQNRQKARLVLKYLSLKELKEVERN
jgi:hypothetical protein